MVNYLSQGQEPAVGKPHGAPRQLVFSSSICWHQSEIFNSTQVQGSFVGKKGLWCLCNQLGFNRPFAQTKSKSNFWKAIRFLPNQNTVSCVLMSCWKWCLRFLRENFVAVWKQSKWHFGKPDISVLFLIEIQHQITCLAIRRGRVDFWKNGVSVDFTAQRNWGCFLFPLSDTKSGIFSNTEVRSRKRQLSFSSWSIEKS